MFRTAAVIGAAVTLAVLTACTTAGDPAPTPSPRLTDLPSGVDESSPSTDTPSLTVPSPTPSRGVTVAGACPGEQLHASVVSAQATTSYRWLVIALTNYSRSTCVVAGYPLVAAEGESTTGLAQVVDLPLRVGHGTVADRRDLGLRSLTMRRGSTASFAIGTTMRNSRRWTITRLSVRTAGANGGSFVAVTLPATQSGVAAIPITVTGLVQGRSGPPRIPRPTPSPSRR